eukprot:COSAG02_NODE_1464_length_12487_cov_122.573297_4_plen_624_part_00
MSGERTLSGLSEGIFDSLRIFDNLEVDGQTQFGSLAVSGALSTGATTASSLLVGPGSTLLQGQVEGPAGAWSISSAGAIVGGSLQSSGALTCNTLSVNSLVSADSSGALNAGSLSVTGAIVGGSLQSSGALTCNTLSVNSLVSADSSGALNAGSLSVTGAIAGGSLQSSGALSALTLAVTTANCATLSVSNGKTTLGSDGSMSIAQGAATIGATGNIAGANLGSNGVIETKDAQGNLSVKINATETGVSVAGSGNIVGGASQQYGILVDTTSLHGGTYHKSLMYANNFQAIIPANSGTGWLPLQVRTHAGVNKFSVDLDGNIDAGSGSITTTGSLSVGAFSTSSLSVVGNSLVHASTGFTTDAGGTYISANGSINLSSGPITCGTIDCEGLDCDGNNITDVGQITAAVGNITSGLSVTGAMSCTTANVSNSLSFVAAGSSASSLVGNTYPGQKTTATNLDLTSSTLDFDETFYNLPCGVYPVGSEYRMVINSGDWRPNADVSQDNVAINDSSASYRGKAVPQAYSMELVAIKAIPHGWKATKLRVNSSSNLILGVYSVNNTAATGSTNLGYGTIYTNAENSLYTQLTASIDTSLMIIVKTTTTSQYVSGGYVTLQKLAASSGF